MPASVTWVTEITHVREPHYFVDEQRIGPYKLWHHEHHLKPANDGGEMTDIVTYQPPLGILGSVANALFIRNQLAQIFAYRVEALKKEFATFDYSSGPGIFGPLTKAAYSKWQKKLGHKGKDADGIPGLTSLRKLGAKHGFTVNNQ